MLKNTKKDESKLEQEIDSILERMKDMELQSDDYEVAVERLSALYRIQRDIPKWNVSPDTVAMVAGNLFGILLILKYEDMNIITSKALGFVLKGRA